MSYVKNSRGHQQPTKRPPDRAAQQAELDKERAMRNQVAEQLALEAQQKHWQFILDSQNRKQIRRANRPKCGTPRYVTLNDDPRIYWQEALASIMGQDAQNFDIFPKRVRHIVR